MAYDYAFVHLQYTIPLAAALTLLLAPLLTRQDLCKTLALILIAFFATLPWDAYLIRQRIWTYPTDAIIGPRLLGVPVEELFFFVIQTYITAMLYIVLNRPVLHAQYLTNQYDSSPKVRRIRAFGQLFLTLSIAIGAFLVKREGQGTYLGLILVWACPFALLTWTLSGYLLISLPLASTIIPIVVPTAYLWAVDEMALGRGTWAIESGTKLGWSLWGSLELEEAIFFLATNTLIVLGLVAFDRAMAVLDTFPGLFPTYGKTLTPGLLIKGAFTDPAKYDMARVRGIRDAVSTLRRKSRSFYLASAIFPGRLRIDLVLLYSFCRVADNLVDESRTETEAREWIQKLGRYLDLRYNFQDGHVFSAATVTSYVEKNFPPHAISALHLLPTMILPREPIYAMLEGFATDLSFSHSEYPMRDEADLQRYAHRVASTVGELCLWLVFYHMSTDMSDDKKEKLLQAAVTMGYALQYVNISRDIQVDAENGRVYLPANWLKENDLSPRDILDNPRQPQVEKLKQRLLDLAFKEYERSRHTMDLLPYEIRGPLVVAVESYMEIGRVLRESRAIPPAAKRGRASVPRARRLWVAWKNLLIS
ncbi:hypothetical protein F5Y16DRAFT_83675 [Xylariaceae sp. FL0255]|nr:hypothetical protein F5Y16DRAFT_83675 [Xylariaceae sp. FL0255]